METNTVAENLSCTWANLKKRAKRRSVPSIPESFRHGGPDITPGWGKEFKAPVKKESGNGGGLTKPGFIKRNSILKANKDEEGSGGVGI